MKKFGGQFGGGILKKPGDWMEKKFGTRSPKELLLKLDQFSKPLPKDVPKEKFHNYCGVLLSIVLYVVLGGFAYFTYTVLQDAASDIDSINADLPGLEEVEGESTETTDIDREKNLQ